ncbi:Uncharacterised protein [Mycobacteroides abscessus subsp. abscessus]|nr:Uncharacterised protein [Mycobacteroides abscessus subsp. abscessus]
MVKICIIWPMTPLFIGLAASAEARMDAFTPVCAACSPCIAAAPAACTAGFAGTAVTTGGTASALTAPSTAVP